MSYTTERQPQGQPAFMTSLIQEAMIGELEAIILYEHHFEQIPHRDVKEVFLEIINDEKEHVEELTLALLHYDIHNYGPIER